MKKRYLLFTAMLLTSSASIYAQGVAVNTTGTAADASAILDASSNTQGMLVPRMDSAHRVGISSPATGLLVYQTDGVAPGFYFKAATGWQSMSAAANVTTQGNTFNGANQLAQLDGSGKLVTSALPTTVTTAGNTFNGANQLASLDGSGKLATSTLPTTVTAQGNTFNGANQLASLDGSGKLATSTLPTTVTTAGNTFNGANQLASLDGSGKLATSTLPTTVTTAGNTFNAASDLVKLDASTKLPSVDGSQLTNIAAANIAGTNTLPAGVLPTTVTLQGNTFNAANDLVKLDASAKLPAVDGSLLTNLPSSGGGASKDSFVLYTTITSPLAAATMYYFPPIQGSSASINATNQNSLGLNSYSIMPYSCTIKSLTVASNTLTAGTGASDVTTIAIFKNGVATGMTVNVTNGVTVGSSAIVTDSAHPFTVAPGDYIHCTYIQTNGSPAVKYTMVLKGY